MVVFTRVVRFEIEFYVYAWSEIVCELIDDEGNVMDVKFVVLCVSLLLVKVDYF